MSTAADTAEIMVASFESRDDGTYMVGRTKDNVPITFKVHPMALGLMTLTAGPCLKEELRKTEAKHGPMPQPPAAPDSPEGLEG